MVAPVISNVFQIGVDNAMITVPQNYMVPANPPCTPSPPTDSSQPTDTQNTTTKDSVTIYLSAIKGFDLPLQMSYYITRIDTYVDPNLPSEDATTAEWEGVIGSSPTDLSTGTPWTNLLEPLDNGWTGLFTWTLQANSGNALNTYVARNFRTLWINPRKTGGLINPNHPPSYQVNIFATDIPTTPNTYAACSFTLVVLPSVADYGLGVTETILQTDNTTKLFGNSVVLKQNGHSINNYATLYFDFCPLESTATDMIPNVTFSPIGITFETSIPLTNASPYPLPSTSDMIDWYYSTISTVPSGSFYLNPHSGSSHAPEYSQDPPSISLASGLTRDIAVTPSGNPVKVTLYLRNALSTSNPNPVLFKLTGTDANGATVSAYTVVTWDGT